MYTHISKLTSKTNTVYNDINDWVDEHGPCGVSNDFFVEDGSLELNEDNTITRTLVYINEEARQAHKSSREILDEDLGFTVELISEISE